MAGTPEIAHMLARIDLQNIEFDALTELTKRWQFLQGVAVVNDDYPRAREAYELALRTFLHACKGNGRAI